MTLFSEQLSAVRKSQWEAQLDAFRTLGSRALDSAEELIALNMRTSRASVEQAAGTFKQLLDARAPGDLALLGSAAQDQWRNLFAYGRELLGIATGGTLPAWSAPSLPLVTGTIQLLPAPTANVPATVPQLMEQAAIATADATTTVSEIAAAAVDTGHALAEATVHAATQAAPVPQPAAEAPAVTELEAGTTGATPSGTPSETPDEMPAADAAPVAQAPALTPSQLADAVIDTALADDVPPARAKPLAKALRDVAPPPAAAEHPIASTLPLEAGTKVDLPIVMPADTAPPLRVVEAKPPRASRKK